MNKTRFTIILLVFLFGIFIFFPLEIGKIRAGLGHNIWGWAWSNMEVSGAPEGTSPIGWISFNSINCDSNDDGWSDGSPAGCPAAGEPVPSYGVNIDSEGKLSGYAYHNMDDPNTSIYETGWISFNRADTGAPPGSPDYITHLAQVDLDSGEVSGWVRALSFSSNWDGWIKLRKDLGDGGSSYGVSINRDTGVFSGWAWGSNVVGWVSFNGDNPEIPGGSDYKALTSFLFNDPPQAEMNCDASSCTGGQCNAVWMAYRPTADPSTATCIYTLVNNSTDPDSTNPPDNNNDIAKSRWYIKPQGAPDTAYTLLKPECSGVCDYTISSDISAGNYTIKLEVEDSQGEVALTTHDLEVKNDAWSDFLCSEDNSVWVSCSSLSGQITQGDTVYFNGSSSSASDGGEPISIWAWTLNGASFGSSSATASVSLIYHSNTIRLTIYDSASPTRTDYQAYIINTALPLPEWTEIRPL